MAVVVAAMLWKGASQESPPGLPPPPRIPQSPLSLEGASLIGSVDAPVAIIEFSDFQCRFCARFATQTLPKLESDYLSRGKAVLAFRTMPSGNQPFAKAAAEASVCAGKSGMFLALHNRLFAAPSDTDSAGASATDQIWEHAVVVGVDSAEFHQCMARDGKSQVAADLELAAALGVTGTPSFFVGRNRGNGRVDVTDRIVGAQPFDVFVRAIEVASRR